MTGNIQALLHEGRTILDQLDDPDAPPARSLRARIDLLDRRPTTAPREALDLVDRARLVRLTEQMMD